MSDHRFRVTFYLNSKEQNKEPERICSCETTRIAEWAKLLKYCKDNEIDFWPNSVDSKISDSIHEKLNCGSFIEDFNIMYGSDDVIPGIEVYLT